VVGQLLQVGLLLGQLLLEVAELLLLALADREVLAGALAFLEGVTVGGGCALVSSPVCVYVGSGG
jgi:hypothetical protein